MKNCKPNQCYRCILESCSANIEIEVENPICLEVYKDNRPLGRFLIRYYGKTIGAGIVTTVRYCNLFIVCFFNNNSSTINQIVIIVIIILLNRLEIYL